MLLKIIILLFSFITTIYANPIPQVIEVGRSTLEDIKRNYQIISEDTSNEVSSDYSSRGWKVYNLDTANLESQKVRSISVMCDKYHVVQSILLVADKSQFLDLYQSLSAQYKLMSDDTSDALGRLVLFASDSVYITLNDSIDSVYLTYTSSNAIGDISQQ